MYVDALVNVGERINGVKKLKSRFISLFRQGRFKLHKRHFNVTILETSSPCNTTELNFAKQQLEPKAGKTKILVIL